MLLDLNYQLEIPKQPERDTFIEPSVEDGFAYLQTLRDTLAVHE